MSAPLAAGAVCGRPGCGHGEDLHDGICFGTACECVRFVESAGALPVPVPVGPEPKADPIAAGRTLDLLALMDERAASVVSPVLAAVLDEAERLRELVRQMVDALNGHDCPPPGESPMGAVTRFAVRLMEAERLVAEDGCSCPPVDRTHQIGCPLDGVPASGPDAVTRVFVPVASLREPEGEFYPFLHKGRVPHDLPETGGVSTTEPAAVCRCDEPDADPYECEADDCTAEFSELNPFGGGGPVEGHDAKVSRTCGCGWRTSVWHVNDGSAEEELHGHVVRVHGGTYPQRAGGA